MTRSFRTFPCLICYMFALTGVCFAVLPNDALAIFGGPLDEGTRRIALISGVVSLVLGILLHVLIYRINPQAFDVREFRFVAVGMGCLFFLLFGVSFVLSRATGLPAPVLKQRFAQWMIGAGIGLMVGVVTLLAFLFLFLYVREKLSAGNRMARLISAGDFAGAIRVGEDALRNKRDYVTVFNLASAYAQHGQRQKAAELLPELEANVFGQKFTSPETQQQMLDRLRAAINRPPGIGS